MKTKHFVALLAIVFLLCACNEETYSPLISEKESETIEERIPKSTTEKYNLRNEKSVLADTNFKNGFTLLSTESNNAYKEKDIDYDGTASTKRYDIDTRTTYWDMCQWWTPFNFKDAAYKKIENTHVYENESRILKVNTDTGELTMGLDADLEYRTRFPETGVLPTGGMWAHFLIQQSFPSELVIRPSEVTSIIVSMDITLDEVTYKGKSANPGGMDSAQLDFYLLLKNTPPVDATEEEAGSPNTAMYFGMPIYDTRYEYTMDYSAEEVGALGRMTGRLIYSISSQNFLHKGPLTIGTPYHIEFDIMDYLQQGYIYGATNTEFLSKCNWNNMTIGYMNFGWESTGNYKVQSTIKNLDIYCEV